jgi:hypothetical protein
MKKKYRVEASRTLLHNGELYEGGQTVELDEVAARALLEIGAILDLEQESEQEAELEPIESEPEPESEPRRRGRPRRS